MIITGGFRTPGATSIGGDYTVFTGWVTVVTIYCLISLAFSLPSPLCFFNGVTFPLLKKNQYANPPSAINAIKINNVLSHDGHFWQKVLCSTADEAWLRLAY